MQIIAQNPTFLGVGMPGADDMEVGVEPGGPNPMLGPDQQGAAPQPPPPPQQPPAAPPQGMRKFMDDDTDDATGSMPIPNGQPPKGGSGSVLPTPSEEDIQRFNLEIQNFESEMDEEEIDRSEE